MSGRIWKILFLLLVAGAGIRYCNLYREEQKIDLSQIPDRTSAEVGKEELMAFLPVWSDYVQQNISELGQKPVSLESGRPEDNLSPKAQEWLLRRGWHPRRFFYVEQRLRAALKTLQCRRHGAEVVKSLQDQLDDLREQQSLTMQPDPRIMSLENSIENMIREQQARADIEKISPAELELVEPLQPVLREVLNPAGKR